MVRFKLDAKRTIPVSVYTLSCKRDLPEQAACIYSFLKNVGTPSAFVVVSDGTYSNSDMALLRAIDPVVRCVNLSEVIDPALPQAVMAYCNAKPMGKKLALLQSVPLQGATIVMDSDILFFRSASDINLLVSDTQALPYYLPDGPGALDPSLIKAAAEANEPVNAGFVVVFQNLDWPEANARLQSREGEYDYFTEQTMVHLAMHASGGRPLDPERYIMQRDDEFICGDRYSRRNIVLRHYTGPIRHKFWQGKIWM